MLQTPFLSATDTSSTIESAGSHDLNGRTACIMHYALGLLYCLPFFWSPFKSTNVSGDFVNGPE